MNLESKKSLTKAYSIISCMLYSTCHNKDSYEDPKTSSVFETMCMLPDELLGVVFRTACFDIDESFIGFRAD